MRVTKFSFKSLSLLLTDITMNTLLQLHNKTVKTL